MAKNANNKVANKVDSTNDVVMDTKEVPVEEVKVETPEVALATSDVEIKATPAMDVSPEKNVKIKMARNHNCCIGGTWYSLEKDKQYNVPENVKHILMGAGLLVPLE